MDAGKIHSAVNFGNNDRYQLVVRQLLKRNNIVDPLNIRFQILEDIDSDYRYVFDHYISPWLNISCKNSNLSNFRLNSDRDIFFSIKKSEKSHLENLIKESKLKVKITYD
jgi:hypothetical protein